MAKLHLVMPMAGRGSRFFENGFVMPKPLIEINDRPFFYWATQSIAKFVDCADITFVVLEEHIRDHAIDREIKPITPMPNRGPARSDGAPPSPPCAGRKACRTMSRCSLMTATTCSSASRSMSFARRAILPTARTAHC